ncbi:hypothetical protein KAJ41_01290 [Candidatus Parcubacteria bacterium]|nr:hypothetical protein [Candidatus Parcubacteria bacterium]
MEGVIGTEGFENKSVLESRIEYHDRELSFDPERGGLLISMKFGDVETLYMDYERLNDPDKSDRGGVPTLFPMAGPKTKEGPFSKLKQHGFARDLPWEIKKNENGEFVEVLKSNNETKEIYPHDFELKMRSEIDESGGVTLTQEVENKGDNEMPVSMGLHPYFNVPEGDKENIKFDFDGGKDIEGKIKKWLTLDKQDENYSAFLERIDNPGEEMKIDIPGVGTIKMDMSKEYEKVWIWTERDKNFICIEPIMHDNDGEKIVAGPVMVKEKDKLSANVKYSFEKEV